MTGLPDMGSAKFKPDTSRVAGLTIAQVIQEVAELVPALQLTTTGSDVIYVKRSARLSYSVGWFYTDGREEKRAHPYEQLSFPLIEVAMREHVRSLGWEYQINAPAVSGEACDVVLTWKDPDMSAWEAGNTEDILDAHDICAVAFMRAFLRMLPQLEQRAAGNAAGEMEA